MILASSPKAERDPSQQRRAPSRDPGGGEIPMKPMAWLEGVFLGSGVLRINTNQQND